MRSKRIAKGVKTMADSLKKFVKGAELNGYLKKNEHDPAPNYRHCS